VVLVNSLAFFPLLQKLLNHISVHLICIDLCELWDGRSCSVLKVHDEIELERKKSYVPASLWFHGRVNALVSYQLSDVEWKRLLKKGAGR